MKILLVDDHEMVRLGLKSYFDLQDDVEVVGEAANGVQGISLALELRPDVIVMDIVMPEMKGKLMAHIDFHWACFLRVFSRF